MDHPKHRRSRRSGAAVRVCQDSPDSLWRELQTVVTARFAGCAGAEAHCLRRTLRTVENRSATRCVDERNATHLRSSTDRVRLMRAGPCGSSIRRAPVFLRAVGPSTLAMKHRRPGALYRFDRCSNLGSHRLFARRERSLPSLVRALLVVARSARSPSRTTTGRSSPRAARRVRNQPPPVAQQPDATVKRPLKRAQPTRIYCGWTIRYGSSSSESTRGVGRAKGEPKLLSPSVIVSLCWIFKFASIKTSSFSEILVTRKRLLSRSPR
jgi:hypothetical protein